MRHKACGCISVKKDFIEIFFLMSYYILETMKFQDMLQRVKIVGNYHLLSS